MAPWFADGKQADGVAKESMFYAAKRRMQERSNQLIAARDCHGEKCVMQNLRIGVCYEGNETYLRKCVTQVAENLGWREDSFSFYPYSHGSCEKRGYHRPMKKYSKQMYKDVDAYTNKGSVNLVTAMESMLNAPQGVTEALGALAPGLEQYKRQFTASNGYPKGCNYFGNEIL